MVDYILFQVEFFSLAWNISFSYWSMVSFKATTKPLYMTYWWSNHFISEQQHFYKITANELVSSMVSQGSVPRTKSYLSVLCTVAHVFPVSTDCLQWPALCNGKQLISGHLHHFSLDACKMWRKDVHTCQFCQSSSSHAAYQLVLHPLEEAKTVKSCLLVAPWVSSTTWEEDSVIHLHYWMEKGLRCDGKSFL